MRRILSPKRTRFHPTLICLAVFLAGALIVGISAQATAPNPISMSAVPSQGVASSNPILDAEMLYRTGKFDLAREKYQQIIRDNPTSAEAYAGLTRVYLKQMNVDQAIETIAKGKEVADSAIVRVALGEVYFRQGKIPEAEREWADVINSGHATARAYLGIARVSYAISMYKRARTMLEYAHRLDPVDTDIQTYWMTTLKGSARIKFLQDYLSRETSDDPDMRARLKRRLDYLLALAEQPKRECHLVGKVSSAETGLARLWYAPGRIRAYGLPVAVNGERANLLLDTGASGILIDRRIAEKAGVTKISETRIGGIGDKGEGSGYVAMAKSIKVGQLEFQNCTVEVLDKRSVLDDNGLIGTDVFEDFLVDIDFPKETLRLSQLPKRPDEAGQTTRLQANGDEDVDEGADEMDESSQPTASSAGPRDRYIAPEMKFFTEVFRFGHMLLIPTGVGKSSEKLFLLDTGAFGNTMSPAAAREVTKVHGNSDMLVKGLSGSVKDVYSADKAVLRFGHLRQPNQDIVTFDLSAISNDTGTEISGTLGFDTLNLLDIKIDYRDGLVNFAYNPAH